MLYQDEIFKDFKTGDVNKASKEIKRYVDIINNKIKPSFNKIIIRRNAQINLKKSLLKLAQTSRRVKIEKNLSKNLRKYVPSKFMEIVVLIDDSKVLEPIKVHESRRSFIYNRRRK